MPATERDWDPLPVLSLLVGRRLAPLPSSGLPSRAICDTPPMPSVVLLCCPGSSGSWPDGTSTLRFRDRHRRPAAHEAKLVQAGSFRAAQRQGLAALPQSLGSAVWLVRSISVPPRFACSSAAFLRVRRQRLHCLDATATLPQTPFPRPQDPPAIHAAKIAP